MLFGPLSYITWIGAVALGIVGPMIVVLGVVAMALAYLTVIKQQTSPFRTG